MASALFTPEQKEIILKNPITNIIDANHDRLPKDLSSFDQDVDEDTKYNFKGFLYSLAGTKPAFLIQLADSRDHLQDRLLRFASAWGEQAKFPTTLYHHCSSLLEEVASPNASDFGIWTAVAKLLIAFNSLNSLRAPTPTPPPEDSSTNIETEDPVLSKLHENWTNDYLPESLDALRDTIRDNEKASDPRFYAKTMIFVQSSGMGKSRLADAFGEECPMINFVLREEGTLGYPPADSEVLSFMCKRPSEEDKMKITNTPTKKLSSKRILEEDKKKIINSSSSKKLKSIIYEQSPEEDPKMAAESSRPKKAKKHSLEPEKEYKPSRISETKEAEIPLESMITAVWNHSIAVGLLQASFEIFNAWVEKQNSKISLKELAAIRHEMMAPCKHDSGDVTKWHRRSKVRTDFCHSVISRAEQIVDSLIRTRDWRHIFHDDRDSHVCFALESNKSLNSLLGEAKKLTESLKRFRHNNGEPLLAMVFDEASSLLKPNGSGKPDPGSVEPGRYHALNRIISSLKIFPIWSFFLSTESQVGILMPANDVKRTGDYSYDPSARIAISDGTSLERFPPFLALQLDVEDRKRMLNPNSRAEELRKAMNEFTRPEHMAMFGRPLWFGYNAVGMNKLAKLKLLGGRQGTTYNANNVHHVFAALSFRLSLDVCLQNPRTISLTRTAVNSFMRVVISMDHDTGVLDTMTPSEPVVAKAAMEHLSERKNWSNSIQTLTSELLDKGLIDKGLKGELYSRFVLILAHDWLRISTLPQLEATFTVQQFLMALYDEKHHKSVLLLPPGIREARMNFNHFVPAGENLRPEVIPELSHDLLRRRAGIQLAHAQPTYDIMIPIYFGNPAKPFKVSLCGTLQLQVKNQNQATTPRSIFEETFTEASQPIPKTAKFQDSIRNGPYFVLNKMTNPVLFLLFDLGIIRKRNSTSAIVQVSRTSGSTPEVWAIHSRGHDGTVFGCLKHMGCVDSGNTFFTSLEAEENAQSRLSQRNKVFSKLGRNFRYPWSGAVHKRGVKRKRNGDGAVESRASSTPPVAAEHAATKPAAPAAAASRRPKRPARGPVK